MDVVGEETTYSVVAGVQEEELGIPFDQEPLLRKPQFGRGDKVDVHSAE